MNPELARAITRLRSRSLTQFRTSKDDTKALAKAMDAIGKQYGKDVIAPIALLSDRSDVVCVSTGLQALDDAISGRTEKINGARKWIAGSGRGLPRGRIVEVFGPESSGKTTLTLQIIAAFQQRGLRCAFIDAEHALDMDYADRVGCDTDSLLYSEGGESAEETLDIVIDLVDSDQLDLIVVDSVAALTPKAELDGEVGDSHMGLHARLMSQACRMINSRLGRGCKTIVLFVNQTRSKIGVMFGNPETTTGGNALKFYASVRLRTSTMGEIKAGGERGQRSKVKVRKTKVSVPFAEIFIDITGGNGITAAYSSDPRGKQKSKAKDDDDGSD